MTPFRLGDHEFLEPGGPPAPLDRHLQRPRKPIVGAVAPSFVERLAVPPLPDGPAALLLDGSYCGHGEPTFTVFDLAIEGSREVELAVPFEDPDEPSVRLRPAGSDGPWQTLLALHELFEYCTYDGSGNPPQPITDQSGHILPVRVAIGFEYPVEAISAEDVSWVAIAIEYGAEREQAIVLSMETA